MDDDLLHIIARLRRAQPRNPDTMAVCDALEQAVQTIRGFERLIGDRIIRPFDKKTYMREYMRKRRAKAKARKTD